MEIVRLWLYKVSEEELAQPDCKISDTNQPVPRVVRGDFRYFRINDAGTVAKPSSRKEADKWSKRTGLKVDTLLGYPAFMHDQGYRV